MNKTILFSLSALLLFINADCKKDPITPDDVKPGSRNYTWTVDTVYAPYNSFLDITGTSATDLWTANPGDADKIFYHYDGFQWTSDLIPRSFSPKAIYSLSDKSVWSSGRQGKIWYYNGIQWSEKYIHTIQGYTDITFEDIYAASETDIYAVGQYYTDTIRWGLMVHYDGKSWKQINIPQIRTAFGEMHKDINGKLYFSGITNEQFTESTYQLYEFDGTTLKQIKSGTLDNNQRGSILQLGNKVYFIIGYDFFDYLNGQFIKIGRLSDSPLFLNAGIGRSVKDIFIGLLDGIAHYNGENTEYLVHFPERIALTGVQIFEKDIFTIGQDMKGNNLIYHGKLNE